MRRFVISGAPGSGKTPILYELAIRGFATVPEAARVVLAIERGVDGRGVPDRNPQMFCELLLAQTLIDFDRAQDGVTFFDRGVVDVVAYAGLFGLDTEVPLELAHQCRYEQPVFITPPWPEIYTTDDERTMTYEMAVAFGQRIAGVYEQLGYEMVEVPKGTPAERAAMILTYA